MTGGFRSVVLRRRPDKGGLVSHLTWCSESVPVSLWYLLSIGFFSSISMSLLSVSRQFKKYYFVFKAKSRLGRYIFKIKVKYLYLLREIPSDSRQTSPPKQIIYNTKE